MKRWYKVIGAIGSLCVLVLMFLYLTGNLSCEGKIAPGTSETKEESAAGLKTFEVLSVTVPVEREAVGTASARRTAEISSKVMAVITTVAANAGDTVQEGQTLFLLDSRDAEARLAQAREVLASAEAALETASLDAGRIERLHEKQAATRQEYDQSQAARKMAKASAEVAKAMVREAEVNLSYSRIESPLAGIIIDRLADPGDMAIPGKPLMSLYDPSTLRLEVAVGERLRPNVRLGETVRVSFEPSGPECEGGIEEVIPASDVSSRSFTVRVSVPETVTVYPGMYGRIWLPVGSAQTILIPLEAVRHVGQLETVIVIEDGVARTRAVKIGKIFPGGIEVLSGLGNGELIAIP